MSPIVRRQITGFSNPTVKFLRSLRDKKHRRREGKFLVEGLRLLTDARESDRLPEILVLAQGRDPHPLAVLPVDQHLRLGLENGFCRGEITAQLSRLALTRGATELPDLPAQRSV